MSICLTCGKDTCTATGQIMCDTCAKHKYQERLMKYDSTKPETCKWTLVDSEDKEYRLFDYYKISCRPKEDDVMHLMPEDYLFCPYCGKKMEIVE